MTGRLRNLRAFWSRRSRHAAFVPGFVPAAPVPAESLRGPEAFPGVLIVKLRSDVDRATARVAELEAERDKAQRQRDAFAVEVDRLREHFATAVDERNGVAREFAATAKMAGEIAEQLAATRRVVAAQAGEIRRLWAKYEQAHRNTVLEHDRVLTLQKANEDLTRELAELRREAAPYGVIAP